MRPAKITKKLCQERPTIQLKCLNGDSCLTPLVLTLRIPMLCLVNSSAGVGKNASVLSFLLVCRSCFFGPTLTGATNQCTTLS